MAVFFDIEIPHIQESNLEYEVNTALLLLLDHLIFETSKYPIKSGSINVMRSVIITKTIGSHNTSEIEILGKYVSGHHAVLIEDGEKIFIEDLGSTFGTHVNGIQISKRTELKIQDRVKIGAQLFHWKDFVGEQQKLESNPIFLADLVMPTGIVNWRDYKFVLLLSLGVVILIPLVVPALLLFAQSVMNDRIFRSTEVIDLTQYTGLVLWFILIAIGYVFLNISQKAIRGYLKGT